MPRLLAITAPRPDIASQGRAARFARGRMTGIE